MFDVLHDRSGWFLSVACVTMVAGCQARDAELGTVQGRVTFGASAVTTGNVVFENSELGWLRSSPLDEHGEYRLENVKLAEYVVSIRPLDPKLPDETKSFSAARATTRPTLPDPPNIPRRYRTTQTTPLKAKVHAGQNDLNFEMSAP